MKFTRLAVFSLCALTAVACEQADDAEDMPADTAAMADPTASNMPAGPTVTNLDDVNDSGIEGEATATHSAQEVTVSILLKGDKAQASASYPAHIHTGTCETGGPVAVELGTVQNLQSSQTIQLSALPANQPAFVQVHGADGNPVACGNMKGHEGDGAAPGATHTTTTSH